jgi:TM2 domain-containing membrane protein YozV
MIGLFSWLGVFGILVACGLIVWAAGREPEQ